MFRLGVSFYRADGTVSKQEQKEDIKSIISRGFNVGKAETSDRISVQEFILFINCVLWPSNDVISMMMVFANFDPDCSGTMDLDEFQLGISLKLAWFLDEYCLMPDATAYERIRAVMDR